MIQQIAYAAAVVCIGVTALMVAAALAVITYRLYRGER